MAIPLTLAFDRLGHSGGAAPQLGWAMSLVVAFFLAREVHGRLRWKVVKHDHPVCRRCGYDLTGNTSGVCPECGERI